MEYEFNGNEDDESESIESGDSNTIDNNDYADYSDEIQPEEEEKKETKKNKTKERKKRLKEKLTQNAHIEKPKKEIQLDVDDDDYQGDADENEPLKEELQEKLHKVFLNYSKFNIQEENFILSHQYFMKMMRDCGLLREKYEKPKDKHFRFNNINYLY